MLSHQEKRFCAEIKALLEKSRSGRSVPPVDYVYLIDRVLREKNPALSHSEFMTCCGLWTSAGFGGREL
jgi:hypothetical protein